MWNLETAKLKANDNHANPIEIAVPYDSHADDEEALSTHTAEVSLSLKKAIIAARSRIVGGAVGMVEHALEMRSKKGIVVLDGERKAQMVSNLLVVQCSERAALTVGNAGSIFD